MGKELRDKLLDAALTHVAFDGWGSTSLHAAAHDIGVSEAEALSAFPKGAVDMASAFHLRGDDLMVARMAAAELETMRYSERVAAAVRIRLEVVEDKELVRRGMTLFSLPQNSALGAQLIWGTADKIWAVLGDTSDDINWYSKRAILSGVYGSCVLFWLGDTSENDTATWEFVNRRIGNVMQFEKFKAKLRDTKGLAPLLDIPYALFGSIKAPSNQTRTDMPGRWTNSEKPNS